MTTTLNRDITEIKVSLGEIKQHLKDINGKVQFHSTFINDKCPMKRSEIVRMINRNSAGINKILGAAVVINLIVVVLVNIFIN